MVFAAHPYASTSISSCSSSSSSPCQSRTTARPKRPSVATRPVDVLPDLSEHDEVAHTSPSPITFARASFISRRGSDPWTDVESPQESSLSPSASASTATTTKEGRRASRPRPVGLVGGTHGLEALLRAAEAEAAPRRAPCALRAPELVQQRSPGAESVTLTIEGLEFDFPRPPLEARSDKEEREESGTDLARTTRAHSPSSSLSSSPSSPSTPGFPLTPTSSDDGFVLPPVAPLSISKSPRPCPRSSPHLASLSSSSSSSSSSTSSPSTSPARIGSGRPSITFDASASPSPSHAQRPKSKSGAGSRNRFSARTTARASVARVFAPLDAVASNTLDLSLGLGRKQPDLSTADANANPDTDRELTLTGVLEEVAREAARNRRVREQDERVADKEARGRSSRTKRQSENEACGDNAEDDSAWIDVDPDAADDDEGRDYYRSDIATHLQLFSSPSPFAPSSSALANSTLATHPTSSLVRHRRGGSASSYLQQQQQFPPSRPDSLPPPPHARTLPPMPPTPTPTPTPPLPIHTTQNHVYARRASASSLASTASGRSTRSSKSTGSQRARSASARAKAKAMAKARTSRARISAAHGVGRRYGVRGPSPLLDPTFPFQMPVEPEPEFEAEPGDEPLPVLPSVPAAQPTPELCVQSPNESCGLRIRPPPRFSLPVDVDFGLEDDMDAFEGLGTMGALKEETEDEGEGEGEGGGGELVFEPEPFFDVYIAGREEDEDEDGDVVDPFAFAFRPRGVRADVPRTPAPESPLSPLAAASTSATTITSTSTPASVPARTSSPTPAQLRSLAAPFLLAPHSPAASSSFSSPSRYPGLSSSSNSSPSLSPTSNSRFRADTDVDAESLFSHDDKTEAATDAASVYIDGAGRVLRSRWSVSTFASSSVSPLSAGTSASSAARSFFPKLQLQLPSRLSARLRAARERQQVVREKERERDRERPEVVRPFPFFPTPTPPSPKRKSNPGPGRYVPKPELMPGAAQGRSPQSQVSPSTPGASPRRRSTDAPAPSVAPTQIQTPTGPGPKERERSSAHYTAQYAQYHAHRRSPEHAAHAHVYAPPRPRESLSAFPFTLADGRASGEWGSGARTETSAGTQGLRRKPIPVEIFGVGVGGVQRGA